MKKYKGTGATVLRGNIALFPLPKFFFLTIFCFPHLCKPVHVLHPNKMYTVTHVRLFIHIFCMYF